MAPIAHFNQHQSSFSGDVNINKLNDARRSTHIDDKRSAAVEFALTKWESVINRPYYRMNEDGSTTLVEPALSTHLMETSNGGDQITAPIQEFESSFGPQQNIEASTKKSNSRLALKSSDGDKSKVPGLPSIVNNDDGIIYSGESSENSQTTAEPIETMIDDESSYSLSQFDVEAIASPTDMKQLVKIIVVNTLDKSCQTHFEHRPLFTAEQFNELESSCSELENKLFSLTEDWAALQSENESLEEKIQEHDSLRLDIIDDLTAQNQSHVDRIYQLMSENEELDNKCYLLEKKQGGIPAREQLAVLAKVKREAEKQVNSLKETVTALNAQLISKSNVDDDEAEYWKAKYQETVKNVDLMVDYQNTAIDSLNELNQNQAEMIKALEQKISILEAEATVDEKIKLLEAEITEVRSSAADSSLQEELRSLPFAKLDHNDAALRAEITATELDPDKSNKPPSAIKPPKTPFRTFKSNCSKVIGRTNNTLRRLFPLLRK